MSEEFYLELEETDKEILIRKREIAVLETEREVVGHRKEVVDNMWIKSLCTESKLLETVRNGEDDKSLNHFEVRRCRSSSMLRFWRQRYKA
jgi:hypothetical protein